MRRPGNNFSIKSFLINQQGQASVFVLVLLGVVLVSAIFLYQSGRITSEKMQLQNAADSAAFGALTLEARSLNFAAYTNRAMIANEVAVGQLIGLLSLADELSQAEGYALKYSRLIEGIGHVISLALAVETAGAGSATVETVVRIITSIIKTIGGVMTAVGEAMEIVLDAIVSPVIGGLSLVNEVYSVSQKIYHGATYALVVKNVYKSLDDNIIGGASSRSDALKNNQSGAQLSDLGVVALVGHLPSFWSGYTTTYSSSTATDKNKAGMGRFAGTVREARDAFSSGGSPKDKNRNWNLDLKLKIKEKIDIIFTKVHVNFDFSFGAESLGASELRNKNNTFIWSTADTSVIGARLSAKLGALGMSFPVSVPGAPFGTGAFQAPEIKTDFLLATDMRPSFPEAMYGKHSDEVYGGAGSSPHALAWIFTGKEIQKDQIETYKGLRPYRDMAQMDEKEPGKFSMPFEAPFFLVGVTRSFKDISSKGPQFKGRFDLTGYDSDTNVDRIGAIAKSELYFARPTDLNYFARKDKYKEKPNVFSPFWQARLVDTNDTDRFLALAMQQKVFWMTKGEKKLVGGDSLDKVLRAVDGILEVVADVFNRITKLFL